MTFRQALELGGHVRKGEKGSPVVYASTVSRKETDEEGQDVETAIPFLKSYTVFNIEKIEALPTHYYAAAAPAKNPAERIAGAEEFFAALRADIRHGGESAFYPDPRPYPECRRSQRSMGGGLLRHARPGMRALDQASFPSRSRPWQEALRQRSLI
jgi:hypothetical protein